MLTIVSTRGGQFKFLVLAVLIFTVILTGCDTPTNEQPKTDAANTNVSGNGNTDQSSGSSSTPGNSSSNSDTAPTVQELTGVWTDSSSAQQTTYLYFDGTTGYIVVGKADSQLHRMDEVTYKNGTFTSSVNGQPRSIPVIKKDVSTIEVKVNTNQTIRFTKLSNPPSELITKIKDAPPLPNPDNGSSNTGSAPTVQELTGVWQKSKIYYYYDGTTGYIAYEANDASLNSGGTFTYANGTLTVVHNGQSVLVPVVKKDASTIRLEAGVDTIELTKLPNPPSALITKIKTAPLPNP